MRYYLSTFISVFLIASLGPGQGLVAFAAQDEKDPKKEPLNLSLVGSSVKKETQSFGAGSSPKNSSSRGSKEPAQASGLSKELKPFADKYFSLSEAMIAWNADAAGLTLENFLKNEGSLAASLVAPSDRLDLEGVSTVGDLRSRLTLSGVTLDVGGVDSLDSFYAEFLSKANTFEGAMALQSASFMSEMASLRMPELQSLPFPELQNPGSIDPSILSKVPAEGLAFGLFTNASLTELLSSSPDVFAQVSASGLGSGASMAAFKQAMLSAGTALGSDISRLPIPCVAEMMQSMATGKAGSSSPGCAPCSAAGAYMHQGAFALLDPTKNTVLPGPGASPSLSAMQPWLADSLMAQNPNLNAQLNAAVSPKSVANSCSGSFAGSSSAVASTLPGVFANLNNTRPPGANPALPGPFSNLDGRSPSTNSSSNPGVVKLPGAFSNLQGPR